MRVYNPKDWFQLLIDKGNAEHTKKLLPMFVALAFYSAGVVYFLDHFISKEQILLIKNVSLVHTILGFVLSLLLVFRTNTAYDRWWEGRKTWGMLVNHSRNLAIKLDAILDHDESILREKFTILITQFPRILRLHLLSEKTRMMLADSQEPEIYEILKKEHPPIYCTSLLIRLSKKLKREGKINDYSFLTINNELSSFMEITGICERIKNTPIPYSYSIFIKRFIFLYILSLPMGYSNVLGYYIIPLTLFVAYVLVTLELIAEEIEDPFNLDENDIPTERIALNIEKNVKSILLHK